MVSWILRCYDPSGDGGGIHTWYDPLPGEVRGAIDAVLERLVAEKAQLTDSPIYKELHGHCSGLDEVIVELDDGRHFRILAFRGPMYREFTRLFGFEKISTQQYGAACNSAKWRKKGVERNAKRAKDCDFP
jgi:hypothetical protein